MIKDRSIQLEGAFNMRDLGGVQTVDGREVRYGKLFRADALHLLTDADIELLSPLSIATVIDLRLDYEIERTGKARLAECGARYVHLPFMGDQIEPMAPQDFPPTMGEAYVMMLKSCAVRLSEIIELMVKESSMPVVFHCAGGKDRTGITAAMIYLLLGVDHETIAADYALTQLALEKINARNPISMYPEAQGFPAAFFTAAAESMSGFVELVDQELGGAEQYLVQAGLKPESIDRLRGEMLG